MIQHITSVEKGNFRSFRNIQRQIFTSSVSSYVRDEIGASFDDDNFTSVSYRDDHLCVASERGTVYVYDRELRRCRWSAHNNAIFDTKWRVDYPQQLVTTSGDLSIRLWDLNAYTSGPSASSENCHLSTVKSLSFCDSNLLATGARDGHIKLWDLRKGIDQISQISEAHKLKPVTVKRPRKGQINRSNPLSSVTCVLFKPNTFYLYSCASGDPKIHLWDLRMLKNATEYVTHNRVGQGYSNLALDPVGRLYASCSDNNIYAFDNERNLIGKLRHDRYSSSSNNMSKLRILDDRWLVAGSAKNSTLIWSLDTITDRCQYAYPDEPPRPMFMLKDEDEVIGLEVDSHTYEIFTCCPESVHRWRMSQMRVSRKGRDEDDD